jgi:putative Mn2+ efflux pump MntP
MNDIFTFLILIFLGSVALASSSPHRDAQRLNQYRAEIRQVKLYQALSVSLEASALQPRGRPFQ